MGASGRERTGRGCPHANALLVEVLHDWRLGHIWRGSLLEVLIGSGMLRKLGRSVGRALIAWVGNLRCL
jgi:hypothetical protein